MTATDAPATTATPYPANQPPEFAPRNLWSDDIALREAVQREGGEAFAGRLSDYGALAGDTLLALAIDAHRDRPRLHTHDRFGERIDRGWPCRLREGDPDAESIELRQRRVQDE